MESHSVAGAETVGGSAQHTQLGARRPRSTWYLPGFLPEYFLVLLLAPFYLVPPWFPARVLLSAPSGSRFPHHKLLGPNQGISKVLKVCGSMIQRCLPLAKSRDGRREGPVTGCFWESTQCLCLLSFCSISVQWFPKGGATTWEHVRTTGSQLCPGPTETSSRGNGSGQPCMCF